ncbi:MAG: site-specific integrase, partial [Thermodesulfobacteriota bacterium]|nr:site-specific integrase [Thermodesulfobacteriota bacterium]
TKEASTHNLYTVALNKAVDAWGDIPLKHITVRHIDNLMADMARSGLSIATVNKNYRHVKAALTKGYEWYDLKPLRFPKQLPETKQVRYLTKNQLHTLIKAIDDPEFADFCWFAAYTGLRSGEILRLQWSDIDNPETGLMRISVRQKNKTESYLPINANTKAILKQCRQRGWKKPFRFTSRTSVSQMFKKAARKAGLGWYRFHDLRHTYGSHLAMAGENEAAIQKLMRHKSIVSTLIYTNLSNEYLKEASEKVNYGPREVGKNKT